MRVINSDTITEIISKMCIDANYYLPEDIKNALEKAVINEKSNAGKNALSDVIKNYQLAENNQIPICQDTGMAVFFVEIGNEVYVDGKSITDAINDGVALGYKNGFLRKSIVNDPIDRLNTNDNTPAIIHYSYTYGDKIKITIAPKGFGSENMSAIKMLAPSDGIKGVKDFVISVVKKAGSNPCPPMIIGIGIGGNFEYCAYLAKKALTVDINTSNKEKLYSQLEKELLEEINNLGIGPQGFGGTTTALGVNILTAPTHIAGLPVAVNISCHATRHITKII